MIGRGVEAESRLTAEDTKVHGCNGYFMLPTWVHVWPSRQRGAMLHSTVGSNLVARMSMVAVQVQTNKLREVAANSNIPSTYLPNFSYLLPRYVHW